MRQNNMGRNQEIISLEEYLQKRQAIREKETQKSRRKHNRPGAGRTTVCLIGSQYVWKTFHFVCQPDGKREYRHTVIQEVKLSAQ